MDTQFVILTLIGGVLGGIIWDFLKYVTVDIFNQIKEHYESQADIDILDEINKEDK